MKNQNKDELKNIFKELTNGNKEIIKELYQKYHKMIYGIAFSILKNKDDSEDIVQTVFSKLYTIEQDKFPNEKEATWLYTVTKNETLSLLRKKNNCYDIGKIYNLENQNNEIEQLLDKENYNQLINKLNNKEKEIVSLRIVSNLSFSQISKLLGEPIGTVKWRYYKSIYALKLMLSNLGMFIITFILGITTFKQSKKSLNAEMKQENNEILEDKENFYGNTESNKSENAIKDVITDNEVHENIIVDESAINNNVNYSGYATIGISSIFLVLTIIFAIILKKHQLNSRKKSSK